MLTAVTNPLVVKMLQFMSLFTIGKCWAAWAVVWLICRLIGLIRDQESLIGLIIIINRSNHSSRIWILRIQKRPLNYKLYEFYKFILKFVKFIKIIGFTRKWAGCQASTSQPWGSTSTYSSSGISFLRLDLNFFFVLSLTKAYNQRNYARPRT